MYYGGGHWGMGLPMILVFIGFLIILYWFMKGMISPHDKEKETPLDILKKRLARGEIDEEQYDKMKKRLESL